MLCNLCIQAKLFPKRSLSSLNKSLMDAALERITFAIVGAIHIVVVVVVVIITT
jgi:hypothetical protein